MRVPGTVTSRPVRLALRPNEVGGKRRSDRRADGLDANRLTGVLDNRAGDTMGWCLPPTAS